MSWSPLDREAPFRYIRKAIELFKERGGHVIVEIGTIRQRFSHPIDIEPDDCPSRLDGHSLMHYANTGDKLWSCDIDTKALTLAREYTAGMDNVTIVGKDGIKFLKNFPHSIDLLSLDAWDVDLPNCAQEHLQAFKAAKRRLHDKTVVIIDDTDVSFIDGALKPAVSEYGGKGFLLVPHMIKEGWQVIEKGRCVILIRE